MTHQPETFLRRTLGRKTVTPQTVAGIGPGSWDSNQLSREQDPADGLFARQTLYRIYTEDASNLAELVNRYFDGATIFDGSGLWRGELEYAAVIEIIGTSANLQKVIDLAGDIRLTNRQTSVIVTWFDSKGFHRFDVVAPETTDTPVTSFGTLQD